MLSNLGDDRCEAAPSESEVLTITKHKCFPLVRKCALPGEVGTGTLVNYYKRAWGWDPTWGIAITYELRTIMNDYLRTVSYGRFRMG